MKTFITILGCGSSLGVPRADGFWGNCDPKNKKNFRTRCSALITKGNNSIIIDTSPDIRAQLLSNKVKNITSVIYTHEHADQTHGINDLRAFSIKNKKKINIYGSSDTIKYLKKNFTYCFENKFIYPAILKANLIKKSFVLGTANEKIKILPIKVKHGKIDSLGYIFNNTAYISDCGEIYSDSLKKLHRLKLLIIDCLKIESHYSHFGFDDVINLVSKIKPTKTVLTNLHSNLDYKQMLNMCPKNIIPAYDGLKIEI